MWHFQILNGFREVIYDWAFPTEQEAIAHMEMTNMNPKAVGHYTARWRIAWEEVE